MCLTIYLLSDRPLVDPTDDAYPGLNLELVDAEYQYYTLEGIRKVANASVVYSVSAAGCCGCDFDYQTLESHLEYLSFLADCITDPEQSFPGTPEEAETFWRSRMEEIGRAHV